MSLAASLLDDHITTVTRLQRSMADIENLGNLLVGQLGAGNKVLLCGNGGSAADAQHIAAELVCRFETTRRGLPAIALTTDTSALTAIGNDLGFDRLFSRQVEALGSEGDVLIAFSTSGNSGNVIAAILAAKGKGMVTIGLLGGDGGKLKNLVDHALVVPSTVTARIQECHILVGHIWCGMIDTAFA